MEVIEPKALIKRQTFAKVGNCYCVFKDNQLVIVIGPHWPLSIVVVSMIIAVFFVYLYMIAVHMEFLWQIGGVVIIVSAFVTYMVTALRDPGIVLNEIAFDDFDTIGTGVLCKECSIFMDNKTEHCEDCGVCMRGLDHHCIFTGKCIAQKNIVWFFAMIGSIFVFFAYIMLWVLVKMPFSIKSV